MAIEMCTASGVCTAGAGYLGVTVGGFFLGTSKDIVLKTYYYTRARFEDMMKNKCENKTQAYAFHSWREAYYRRKSDAIHVTSERIVKAIATGVILALAVYLASKYIG